VNDIIWIDLILVGQYFTDLLSVDIVRFDGHYFGDRDVVLLFFLDVVEAIPDLIDTIVETVDDLFESSFNTEVFGCVDLPYDP